MAKASGKAALKQRGEVQTSRMFGLGTGSLVIASLRGDDHSPGQVKLFFFTDLGLPAPGLPGDCEQPWLLTGVVTRHKRHPSRENRYNLSQ